MAFRERVKRALGRKSSSNSSSTSNSVKKTSSGRRDSSVWYQPGEKLPPLKYRRPVTKEHKELLESFSFAKAWRRRSDMSQYSPMGSRFPSRKNSRKSTTAPARRTQVIEDVSDDQDVANAFFCIAVGLSPQRSRGDEAAPSAAAAHRRSTLATLTSDARPAASSPNSRPQSSDSTHRSESNNRNSFGHHAFAQDLLHALNHSRVAVA
ncbi:uncharacterized protein BKA78DRAFT_353634 [Phyllosticta capitalensis]|uniref:Uncharacterized protein n=1 Tax=Phyllosticta capitalensis TaxID=121624 RepID=A0ABR1YMG8_9PEZI